VYLMFLTRARIRDVHIRIVRLSFIATSLSVSILYISYYLSAHFYAVLSIYP
jgi:hypothetical protein